MPKLTAEQRLEQIDASRQRWQRRLTRATNALGKLERERKRVARTVLIEASEGALVVAKVTAKRLVADIPDETKRELQALNNAITETLFSPRPKPSDVTDIPASELPIADVLPGDDLGVPAFLKRDGDLAARIEAAKQSDAAAKEKALGEREKKRKAKSRGRVARLQAKASGALTAMPLTGRAALEAIRRGSR